jgi:hypothetical protein
LVIRTVEDGSNRVLLLGDVRALFAERGAAKLSSSDLVLALGAMEDRPWPEFSGGKPITQTKLARMLRDYGIAPVERAYQLFQFEDAFERYL